MSIPLCLPYLKSYDSTSTKTRIETFLFYAFELMIVSYDSTSTKTRIETQTNLDIQVIFQSYDSTSTKTRIETFYPHQTNPINRLL